MLQGIQKLPTQYGFKSNHSKLHTLIDLLAACYDDINDNNYTSLVLLDLKKAFDTVNHKILLNILDNYSFYFFIFIYFISICILLTRRKATEALLHRVGNYPNLLLEVPRYCCSLVI